MSRKKLFLIIGICLIIATFVFVMNRHTEKSQASGSNDMFQEIDNSALAAQSGDQHAVSSLVDTIFVNNSINELDPNLVSSLKDRIVRAEMNGQTVSETQVVQAVNWLADQFSAPVYAKTSLLQTRVMRTELHTLMPNLFVDKDGQGSTGIDKLMNSEPSSNIPPTQGVSLLILMIHQKMLNEDFQKESNQWDSDFLAALQSSELAENANEGGGTPTLSTAPASQKDREMLQLVYGANLTSSDAERLTHGTLDQLGIPR